MSEQYEGRVIAADRLRLPHRAAGRALEHSGLPVHVLPPARRVVDLRPAGRTRLCDPRTGAVARYRFRARTADFLVCRRCGGCLGAQMVADGRTFGIVNLHALRDLRRSCRWPSPCRTTAKARASVRSDACDVGHRSGRQRSGRANPMAEAFVYVWEFQVDETRSVDFERHYGPCGTWAALFARAPGYLGTQLLRDEATPDAI